MQNQAATVWCFQPIENANTNQWVTNQHPSYIAWTFWNEDQFFFVITSPEQSRSWSLWWNLYVQYFWHLCCFLVRSWNALNPHFDLTAYCDKYHFNLLEHLSLQLPRPWCHKIDSLWVWPSPNIQTHFNLFLDCLTLTNMQPEGAALWCLQYRFCVAVMLCLPPHFTTLLTSENKQFVPT